MDNLLLLEDFKKENLDKRLKWFCPPKQWEVDRAENRLVIKTEKETDFWQKTHYGFQVDNGHFLYCEMEGNFRVTTKIHSYPVHKYDQAGVMVRFSKDTWIK